MGSDRSSEARSKGFSVVQSEDVELPSKICGNCGIEYTGDLEKYFAKRRHSVDGYRNECRSCINKKQKQRYRGGEYISQINDRFLYMVFKDAAKEILKESME